MDTIGPSRLPTMPRCLFSSIWVSRDRDDLHVLSFRGLYALYASKSSLCTLCKHITPELTAYNAYKKTAWLRSRAEGTKMYAVGDAYKVHTECIQAYKKRKREDSSSYFFILPVLLSLLPAISGIHKTYQASLPVLLGRIAATFGGLGRLPTHVTCMHCMHQKAHYARYAGTQLRKRLHTMHTRRRFGSGVGLRARKCMHLRMHTKRIQNAYKHVKREKERIPSSTSSLYCLFFYLLLPVF